MAPNPSSRCDSPSLKIALAIALLRYKNLHRIPSSDSDAQRWKRKAKDRKREILRLREELKQIEDGMRCDAEPPIVSCRCHFFDGFGEPGGDAVSGAGEHWIDEVLRRRFLRLVRWKEKRKRVDGSIPRRHLLASLKNLLSSQEENEVAEDLVNGLIMRLTRRMCAIPKNNGSTDSHSDSQFYVQHLIRRLGNEPFIGQRIILAVSQEISVVAESLLLMDPFDDSFPSIHDTMFMMIQVMEFLILDYMKNWLSDEYFDTKLFEEWVRSVLLARKNLELLECRNGLYMLYAERIIGELAKQNKSASWSVSQMKTGHLPYLLLILFLKPIWSGANESTSSEIAGVHQSPELSLGQHLQGLNATVKLNDSESMKGESKDLDPMHRVIHPKKGGAAGKGGGRSVGGGGAQAAREPGLRRNDAPSILWFGVSFTQIIFHELLVSVLFF
ncbi:protein MULTIPOLAR SPINDLE 1 isoform X3 [Elaeis guineensis]|uniref:Protein MULTIPOLAR SPINDLE 1 isoform X3 n=1 Tax=Elaeis guineensis var. tenera TaxID=51953 RepID=A0A8N4EPS9_ELAGV|nr:protein MULTIPOLAR SPINDLE 1 isoform X3 [Elaeis guineensis]